MKITAQTHELVPLDRLHHDPRNARVRKQKAKTAIRKSLERFGQVRPIVALRDGRVIAGNGTLEAARDLGATEIAVVWFDWEGDDLAEAAKAYALADNRTAELADWDLAELQTQLAELQEFDASVLVGWEDTAELEVILAAAFEPGQANPDALVDELGARGGEHLRQPETDDGEPEGEDQDGDGELEDGEPEGVLEGEEQEPVTEDGPRETEPPAGDQGDDDGDGERQDPPPAGVPPIKITGAQREIFERAATAIRTNEQAPHLTDGQIVEWLAADFLAGYTGG